MQLSWSEYLSVWSPQGINLSCCKLHYDQEYSTSVQFHWENPASPPSPHLCRRNLLIGGQGCLLCIWDLSVRPPAPVVWCFLNAVLRCVRACLSLNSDVPLLSHLQGVLGPLGPLRRIWLAPANGLVAHWADAANFQPLHQTPEQETK